MGGAEGWAAQEAATGTTHHRRLAQPSQWLADLGVRVCVDPRAFPLNLAVPLTAGRFTRVCDWSMCWPWAWASRDLLMV
jgi:hypothetical protein